MVQLRWAGEDAEGRALGERKVVRESKEGNLLRAAK